MQSMSLIHTFEYVQIECIIHKWWDTKTGRMRANESRYSVTWTEEFYQLSGMKRHIILVHYHKILLCFSVVFSIYRECGTSLCHENIDFRWYIAWEDTGVGWYLYPYRIYGLNRRYLGTWSIVNSSLSFDCVHIVDEQFSKKICNLTKGRLSNLLLPVTHA